MKLFPYLCSLAILALVKQGLATTNEHNISTSKSKTITADETNVATLHANMNHMLQSLLHFGSSSSTQPQKDLVSRIMTRPCIDTNEMICVVDTMLREVTQDLVENGITDATAQLNIQKFDQILSQILNRLDKHTFAAYIPYVEATKEFHPKENLIETDKELRTYAKLTQDFYSMLVNPTSFSPSGMVSPFIINDASLRKKAIKRLTTSSSFKLQPVETNDHFQGILNKIKEQVVESASNSDFDGIIVLELNSIFGLDAIPQPDLKSTNIPNATPLSELNSTDVDNTIPLPELNSTNVDNTTPLPELNSTDIANATVIIDQSNSTLFTPPFGEDANKLALMNAIIRSLLGDLLDIILDLPDRIIGSNGGLLGGKDGIAITISLGGKKQGNDKNNNDRNHNNRNNNRNSGRRYPSY